MKKTSNQSASGFTIVETMIVLAITGVLAIAAFNYVSGRTGNTEFNTGIHSIEGQMESIINLAQDGYYPSDNNFSCTGGSPGIAPSITPSPTNQGQNSGCILLGKILEFNTGSYTSYPVVGLEYGGTGNSDSMTLNDAVPITLPVAATTSTMEFGLTVHSIDGYIPNSSGPNPATAVGFIAGDENGNIETTNISNPTNPNPSRVNLSLYYLTSGFNPNSNTTFYPSYIQNANKVDICFSSGTNDDSGLITIGGQEGGTGVTLTLYGDTTCT